MSASASGCSGPTSTNTAELHTMLAIAATIAKRQPHARGDGSLFEARENENASHCTAACTTNTAVPHAAMLRGVVYGHAMTATSAAIRIAEPEAASVLSYRSATRCCSTRRARAASISPRVGGVDGGARKESATLRDENGLRAIADIEGLEHGTDVCLHRALCDIECACNLLVRESAAQHADDFELSQRQPRRLRRDRGARLRGHEHLAREHLLDCGDHFVGRERFRNESRCARRNGARGDTVAFVAREHDASGRWEARADQLQCVKAVVALLMNGQEDEADVGVAAHGSQALRHGLPTQHTSYERPLSEHRMEARPEQRMAIDDEDFHNRAPHSVLPFTIPRQSVARGSVLIPMRQRIHRT